jgi:hypothetical protein
LLGGKICIIAFIFNLTKKKIKYSWDMSNNVNNMWTYHLFWTISSIKKWHQLCFHLATKNNYWLFYCASQLEFYWVNIFVWLYFYSSFFRPCTCYCNVDIM